MTIWMKVTKDKYELPVAVADSASELARKLGCNVYTIYSAMSHVRTGRNKSSIYKKVEIEDESCSV